MGVFVDLLQFVPLVVGLLFAVVQFVPEMQRKCLKLTLHLPCPELRMIGAMLLYGVLLLGALFAVSLGVLFVAVPLISAIMAPKGVVHIFKNLFAKWDSDDKKWMILFFPYLFMARFIHMPDQSEVKSGQRFADGMLWLFGGLMGITGIALLLDTTVLDFGATVYGVMLFLHDLGFLGIAVFGLAHIFLGGGIFQPYRGMHRAMFGDGLVSESDALYHWGHWARAELEDGKNVVEKRK